MTQPYPDHIRLGPGEDSVILLDQTQLPNRLEERQVRSLAEMIEAIRSLRVLGRPCHWNLCRVLPVCPVPSAGGAGVEGPGPAG